MNAAMKARAPLPNYKAQTSLDRLSEISKGADKPAISVVGLGYVGAVSMACLSHLGFRMVGVDVCHDKISSINEGRAPIVEDRLGELLADGVAAERISATDNLVAAVLDTDVTFMSVGTPTSQDGSCDLTYVRQASRAIGQALAMKESYHVVVLRCSVPPGTTMDVVAEDVQKASGKMLGRDFGMCFNPEFLREGVAVADFFEPPKTVVGASDQRAAETVSAIYGAIDDKVIFTSIAAAEMVKYVDNIWHAAKVAFGNEVGRICKALEIDSHDVMNIFVQDTKLNLSPYYLKPGFAFGGSCLPKEVRAVGHLAEELNVDVALIDSLMISNKQHVAQAMSMLTPHGGKRFGFLGLTFKPNTDDLRESPTLDLMAQLMSNGENISAFDPNLDFGPLLQGQINYVRHAVPHQADLMDNLETMMASSAKELIEASDVIIVSHATDAFRDALEHHAAGKTIVDLARLFTKPPVNPEYCGIAW